MSGTPSANLQSPQFKNAPGFSATGRGYYNKLPNFPATTKNANGLLVNRGLDESDDNYQMPVFIHLVSTAWTVSGTYGQAANGRTWYPHNLSQAPLTLSGIVANMYEYDRLVEFVRQHQISAVQGWATDPNAGIGLASGACEFTLKPYIIDTGAKAANGAAITRTIYGGLPTGDSKLATGQNGARIQGYIAQIQAGHQRYVNAVEYEIAFQLSYDYLDGLPQTQQEIDRQLVTGYMKTFNQLYGRDKAGNLLPTNFTNPPAPATASSDFWQATTSSPTSDGGGSPAAGGA